MAIQETARVYRAHVDWGPVFAGAAMATAIALVLLTFGAALGLSVTSPYEGEGLPPIAYAVGAGLWLLWVQLLSFSVGGYVAARLRPRLADISEHETDVRDGLHGLLVWAIGVIAAAMIAFAGIGGIGAAADDSVRASNSVSAVSEVLDEQAAQAAAAERTQGSAESAQATGEQRRVEITRKLAVISAFITAASLLAGAVAAFFGAFAGARHRDEDAVVKLFAVRHDRPALRSTPAE